MREIIRIKIKLVDHGPIADMSVNPCYQESSTTPIAERQPEDLRWKWWRWMYIRYISIYSLTTVRSIHYTLYSPIQQDCK